VVAATAETSGESAFNERPSDQRSPTTPLRSAAGTEIFLSMTAPAPLVELTDLSSAVPLGSMMRDTATGVPAVLIAAGETSRVLSTPDPKLSFGERVQAFADAVAQRVLGQIRDENWSVTLQLEPANMGVMDIDLSMRGNAVVANVGVASGEVRALLESGLPRLRDSMESAGLQLAGWTFGQSGSRAFSDPARKMFTQASFRGRVDDVDPVSEAGVSRVMRAKDLASGAVDLFV
jgi:flagellar hook-length control protein FliK